MIFIKAPGRPVLLTLAAVYCYTGANMLALLHHIADELLTLAAIYCYTGANILALLHHIADLLQNHKLGRLAYTIFVSKQN